MQAAEADSRPHCDLCAFIAEHDQPLRAGDVVVTLTDITDRIGFAVLRSTTHPPPHPVLHCSLARGALAPIEYTWHGRNWADHNTYDYDLLATCRHGWLLLPVHRCEVARPEGGGVLTMAHEIDVLQSADGRSYTLDTDRGRLPYIVLPGHL